MSAPLHSRFCRYFERDSRIFSDKVVGVLRQFRRPARIYSMTPNASFEAGALSGAHPRDLLAAYHALYDPGGNVWIELHWRDAIRGMFEAGVPVPEMDDGHPVKVGFLVVPRMAMGGSFAGTAEFAVLNYYLYPNGSNMLGPTISMVSKEAALSIALTPEYLADFEYITGIPYQAFAMGPGYLNRWRTETDRKTTLDLALLGAISLLPHRKARNRNAKQEIGILCDVNGNARIALAALATVLYAKPVKYREDPDLPPVERNRKSGARSEVVEIDVYVKPKVKPGHTVIRHINAAERAKKRRHDVLAHWAYRQRKDGSDPLQCLPGRAHSFENVEGTKSQVCIYCDQKRWFRDKHERGDATLGAAPPKIYNVRAG